MSHHFVGGDVFEGEEAPVVDARFAELQKLLPELPNKLMGAFCNGFIIVF